MDASDEQALYSRILFPNAIERVNFAAGQEDESSPSLEAKKMTKTTTSFRGLVSPSSFPRSASGRPLFVRRLRRSELGVAHLRRLQWVLSAAILSLLILDSGISAHASSPVRTVLHSSYSPIIDGESFGTWSQYLTVPALNNAGQTAFVAHGTDQVILAETVEGGLRVVARNGTMAPGTDGLQFGSLSEPNLNENGDLAFSGLLVDRSGNIRGDGIWIAKHSAQPTLIAHPGDPVPNHPNSTLRSVGPPLLSNGGSVAFNASAFDQNGEYRVAVGIQPTEQSEDLLVFLGHIDVAPGTNEAVFNGFDSLAMNENGTVSFVSGLLKEDGESSVISVLWTMPENEPLRMSLRRGDLATGLVGRTFTRFRQVTLNNNSDLAVRAQLSTDKENSPQPSGIWAGPLDNLRLIAVAGTPAPGQIDTMFEQFGSVLINAAGQVAFRAEVSINSERRASIWLEAPDGNINSVAMSKEDAPDTDGAQFHSLSYPSLNSKGQIAFLGGLVLSPRPPTDPDGPRRISTDSSSEPTLVSGANDTGIWATDRHGMLRLVVREGELLDVAPGPSIDLRTISLLNFITNTGNEDARPSGFNDLGQLAFYASFTDGSSGVFVSNAVAVPEPTAETIALSLFFLLRHRKH
jgi:hypothetical protein